MLLEYNRYISYNCPVCGMTTKRRIVPFSLSGLRTAFSCAHEACRHDIFTVIDKKDKYVIEYLCAACGGTHRFTVGKNSFWSSDIILITCPETMLDMIAIGTEEKVESNLQKQKEMYHKAEKELYSDPELSLYFDIIGAINNISKSGMVICTGCPEKAADLDLVGDEVLITCRKCGASKSIPITKEAFNELSETGTIVLE